MPETLTVDSKELKELVHWQQSNLPLTEIRRELWDETRWGHIEEIIFQHDETGFFYVFYYESTSGDGDYNTFDNVNTEYDLVRVYPHEVTKIEYKAQPQLENPSE